MGGVSPASNAPDSGGAGLFANRTCFLLPDSETVLLLRVFVFSFSFLLKN